jgi:hypothetical protein
VKILVLGCGPSGLLAAHAASLAEGATIKIVSKKRPSELFGCQYLHGPIPDLNLRTTTVNYELRGTVDDYATKVYGNRIMAGTVSPEVYGGPHPAWDLRQAYEQLYDRYYEAIEDCELMPDTVGELFNYLTPDLIVSSIPLPVLCQRPEEHAFRQQSCWAIGDAPERGQTVPVPCPEDTIVCNGERDTGWYRVSNVFGYRTAEWPGLRPRPPFAGVVQFAKPLATTCTCWHVSEGEEKHDVLRVGRYGTWTKGVLSHEAFNDTAQALIERIHSS